MTKERGTITSIAGTLEGDRKMMNVLCVSSASASTGLQGQEALSHCAYQLLQLRRQRVQTPRVHPDRQSKCLPWLSWVVCLRPKELSLYLVWVATLGSDFWRKC